MLADFPLGGPRDSQARFPRVISFPAVMPGEAERCCTVVHPNGEAGHGVSRQT